MHKAALRNTLHIEANSKTLLLNKYHNQRACALKCKDRDAGVAATRAGATQGAVRGWTGESFESCAVVLRGRR